MGRLISFGVTSVTLNGELSGMEGVLLLGGDVGCSEGVPLPVILNGAPDALRGALVIMNGVPNRPWASGSLIGMTRRWC